MRQLSPADRARLSGIGEKIYFRQVPTLSPTQAAAYQAFLDQFRLTPFPYYSTVKLVAQRVGPAGGPYQWVFVQGTEVFAFAYARGRGKVQGGFTIADGNATIADTNLENENQTTGGQNVLVHGIAVQVLPAMSHRDNIAEVRRIRLPDHRMLAGLIEAVGVELQLNGAENQHRLGRIVQIPGAGGMVGGGYDATGFVGEAGDGKNLMHAQNGWQTRSNFFHMREGLVWRPQGTADSNLNIKFTITRDVTIHSGGSLENQAAAIGGGLDLPQNNAVDTVATAQPGYEYPTEIGVELLVHFLAKVKGPRTRVA